MLQTVKNWWGPYIGYIAAVLIGGGAAAISHWEHISDGHPDNAIEQLRTNEVLINDIRHATELNQYQLERVRTWTDDAEIKYVPAKHLIEAINRNEARIHDLETRHERHNP